MDVVDVDVLLVVFFMENFGGVSLQSPDVIA